MQPHTGTPGVCTGFERTALLYLKQLEHSAPRSSSSFPGEFVCGPVCRQIGCPTLLYILFLLHCELVKNSPQSRAESALFYNLLVPSLSWLPHQLPTGGRRGLPSASVTPTSPGKLVLLGMGQPIASFDSHFSGRPVVGSPVLLALEIPVQHGGETAGGKAKNSMLYTESGTETHHKSPQPSESISCS